MKSTFLFLFFLSLPSLLLSNQLKKLFLPSTTTGPEALAFDLAGRGPYTGVSDGRILKYINPALGFVDFAITSPSRPKRLCDGSSNLALEPTCGRPLGLGFNYSTGNLYIADAYFGLVMVGPNGGVATQLATSAEGVPFRFTNALDVDQDTGMVYFTDASSVFPRNQFNAAFLARDRSGRLLKYDPRSNQVTVLLRNLGLPVGLAVSEDGLSIIFSELLDNRAVRYWLHGPKAFTTETFAVFNGMPDNIRRNAKREYWVAINRANGTAMASLGMRLGEDGRVLETLTLSAENPNEQYSEVQEYKGKIYLGSVMLINYVGVLC